MPLSTTNAPSESSFTVGWICVLQKEYLAAHKLFDEEYTKRHFTYARNDLGSYDFGRIGDHKVVLSVPGQGASGSIEAAHIATMMKSTFPWLRLFLLVGIGGGVSNKEHDVRLGDIVLGTEIVDYDKGKWIQDGFERTGGSIKPPLQLLPIFTKLVGKVEDGLSLENEIKNAARRFGEPAAYARPTRDRLYEANYLHKDGCDCSNNAAPSSPPLIMRRQRVPSKRVVLHQGIIASANKVMKNAIIRDQVAGATRCICFEMEAVGMTHIPNSISIRGISDYSDPHKNDAWHNYASLAAAVGARELLLTLDLSDLDRCHIDISVKEVGDLIHGATDLLNAYSQNQQNEDPESLPRILRKLTERQELMEQLINRDLENWKSSTKGGGDDPKSVEELGKQVIQLKQSHGELKDCFVKLNEHVKKCNLSRNEHLIRPEWEEFQQQVELNTANVADFERSTDDAMNTMENILRTIGEQTGEEGLWFASVYIKLVNQLRKAVAGLSGPVGTSKGSVEHKRSTQSNTHGGTKSNSETGMPSSLSLEKFIRSTLKMEQRPDESSTRAASPVSESRNSSIPRSAIPLSDVTGNRSVIDKPLSAQTTANDAPHPQISQEKLESMSVPEKARWFDQQGGNF